MRRTQTQSNGEVTTFALRAETVPRRFYRKVVLGAPLAAEVGLNVLTGALLGLTPAGWFAFMGAISIGAALGTLGRRIDVSASRELGQPSRAITRLAIVGSAAIGLVTGGINTFAAGIVGAVGGEKLQGRVEAHADKVAPLRETMIGRTAVAAPAPSPVTE